MLNLLTSRESWFCGGCSWCDVHVDAVAGAPGVGVALRAGVRKRDPELVVRRFAGGVEAVAVAKPSLAVCDHLVEDPPAPALLDFDVERHSLRGIWSAGHCAGPIDRVSVAGVVGFNLSLIHI